MDAAATGDQTTNLAILIWGTSLALGLVVALVVTLLLWLIYRTAVGIDDVASDIWDTGQRVANNTVHIPILYCINHAAGSILGTAVQIIAGSDVIKTHAKGCPGCPQCMLKH
jgi:hypothetical protein